MDNNSGILKEFWLFIREKKKYWLIPILILLVLAAILIIFANSSAISPFVYALF